MFAFFKQPGDIRSYTAQKPDLIFSARMKKECSTKVATGGRTGAARLNNFEYVFASDERESPVQLQN